jgi:cyclohexanecarboxylate-CoA ligase
MLFETILRPELAARYRAAGWWSDRLLNDAVDEAVARQPGRTALVDTRRRMTYAELQAHANRCALGLVNLGVRRGDVVMVQLPNWSEFVVATLALERIGAVINPVAPIFRERELRSMLRLAAPVAAIFASQFRGWDYGAMFAQLRSESVSLRLLIGVDSHDGEQEIITWQHVVARGAELVTHRPTLDRLRPSPDDVTELMFTSGTTGEPKGVLHTANTLNSAAVATIRDASLTGEDVIHMASTLGHQTGFLYGVRLPLLLGATAVYQDRWDAEAFVRLVDEEKITLTVGATPFLADTLRACRHSGQRVPSLRAFVCGGAPIPQPLADQVVEQLACRLVPCWGMTETAIVTSVQPSDPPEKVATTDGRPCQEMDISIRDSAGLELPAGQEGDLLARGAFTFVGYVQGRRFTEQCFTRDGWLKTGDRARRDSDGYVRITGRSKDIIIRGGENVPVKEIEDVLLCHPKVRTVAMVGVPDERLGEVGCACIILEPGETLQLEEVRTFLAERQVTRQFWPEQLELMTEFPMTPSGKVQKFQLRDMLARTPSSATLVSV